MREDMFKVIVERPRRTSSYAYKRDGRRYRNQEDAPMVLGMKRGYSDRKWLNENLAPLERYLESQVDRPWNKVYSDICAQIDTRSTVKQHILQHLEDFVALDVRVIGDEIFVLGGWQKTPVRLQESRFKLFVDPRSGILRQNRRHKSWSQQQRDQRAAEQAAQSANRRVIGEMVQWHRVDGIWYEVELDTLPEAREILQREKGQWVKRRVFDKCRDVLRKEWVSRDGAASNVEMYGKCCLYAKAKRQLNSRELHRFGLQSK